MLRNEKRPRRAAHWNSLWLAAALLVLAACGRVTPQPSSTITPTAPAVSPAPPTAAPSPTPTDQSPLVILLDPPGSDRAQASQLQQLLEQQALLSGLRFERREALAPADVQQGVRIVVGVAPAENLITLAAAAPQTAFIAVDASLQEAGANLSIIQPAGSSVDRQAFVAGYLAALLAEDWRIGMLAAQDAPESAAARLAYANGLAFLCGLCRPVYPPFPIPGYPIVVELPVPSEPANWETALAELQTWQVQVVYVTPQAASPGLYQALAQAGFLIIGSGSPPDGTAERWITSLDSQDLAPVLLQAWQVLLSGGAGQVYRLELALSQTNPELLSSGRQRWVETVLADLAGGFIDTGVSQLTPAP